MEPTAYFELNFTPNVALVSVVRKFVAEFYQRTLGDDDGTSRVAMATHELLENAVRYSKDGETTIRIDVEPTLPKVVHIRMRNRAEPKDIAAIREVLDAAAKAPDASAFYQAVILKRAKDKVGSGLGLARVCAEGEMTLKYELDGDLTTIEATTVMARRTPE